MMRFKIDENLPVECVDVLKSNENSDTERNVNRRFMQVIMQIVLFAVLLFVSAGRLLWSWAWYLS